MANENETLIVEMDLKYKEFIRGAGLAADALMDIEGSSKELDTELRKLEKQLAIAKVRMEQGDKAATQFALALELGSKGSKEQRKEIMRLTAELQDMDAANRVAGRSGFDLANVGYQIQDAMVQAQMGTSAFVIVAQQAPQLFAGMGGAASILGTVIAGVAIALSVLNPELMESKTAVEKFDEAIETLNQSLEETSDGSIIVSEKIRELAKVSETAAKVQLSLSLLEAKKALNATRDAVVEATTAYDDWAIMQEASIQNAILGLYALDRATKETGKTTSELLDNPTRGDGLIKLREYVEQVGEKLGTTTDQTVAFIRAVKQFQDEKSPESMLNLANTISLVATNTPNANKELLSLASKINNAAVNATTASQKVELFEELIANLPKILQESTNESREFAGAIKGMIESLEAEAELFGKTDRERAVYVAGLKGATEEELRAINAAYDKIEANEKLKRQQKDQLEYFEEQNKLDAEYIENQKKKEEAALKFSDGLTGGAVSSSDPERFEREREQQAAHEQAMLEQAMDYYLEGAYGYEQYQANLTAIGMQGAEARMKIDEMEAKNRTAGLSSMFSNLSTLMSTKSRGLFEIGKASAIANAVVSATETIPHAYKWGTQIGGPVLGASFAAAAGIAQAANIAAIESTSFGSKSANVASQVPATPTVPETSQGQNLTIDLNITGASTDIWKQAVVETFNSAVDDGYNVRWN